MAIINREIKKNYIIIVINKLTISSNTRGD